MSKILIEQMEMVIPFITGEIAFRQDIGKLVLGINIFDLDLWSPS